MMRIRHAHCTGDGSVECSGDTGASSQWPLLQCLRHQSWKVHPLTLTHLSSSPIFADAINLLCIPNLQVVFSSAELRAPPSLWFPELAESCQEPDSSASLEQSGPVETSRDQSRGSEFGTIVKLGPGGGGAAPCSAAAAGLRIPHSLGCLR